jgi:CRP-like cAMP-binding protein
LDIAVVSNKLLGELPRADFDLLASHLATQSFAQTAVLTEAGDQIEEVFFPATGMISLLTTLSDGKAIETATVGREGLVGGAAAFGPYRSPVRAVVQIQMTAAVLPAVVLRRAAESSKAIQLLCIRYNEVLLAQARITAACNALHMIEARFCRWLLQTSHVSASTTVTLTQEFLSEMLGVRRTSVTEVASKLQAAGIISYSRGVIRIVDAEALRQRSCECFENLMEQKAI